MNNKIFVSLLCLGLVALLMIPIAQLFNLQPAEGALDVQRAELNNLSLKNVFVDNRKTLADYQRNENPDFTTNTTGWTISPNFTSSLSGGILSLTANQSGASIFQTISNSSGYFYTNARVKTVEPNQVYLSSSTISGQDAISTYAVNSGEFTNISAIGNSQDDPFNVILKDDTSVPTTFYVDYFYTLEVEQFFTDNIFSPFFNTTFDNLTNNQKRHQFDEWVLEGIYSINIWLTYHSLGLDQFLSKNAMLYYYNLYLSLI